MLKNNIRGSHEKMNIHTIHISPVRFYVRGLYMWTRNIPNSFFISSIEYLQGSNIGFSFDDIEEHVYYFYKDKRS